MILSRTFVSTLQSHIKPMWEDPVNKYGGKWVLTMKNQPEMLNQVWLEMVRCTTSCSGHTLL